MAGWHNSGNWNNLQFDSEIKHIMEDFPDAVNERYAIVDPTGQFTLPTYFTPGGPSSDPGSGAFVGMSFNNLDLYLTSLRAGIDDLITDMRIWLDPGAPAHVFTSFSDAAQRITGTSTQPGSNVRTSLALWEWYQDIFKGLYLIEIFSPSGGSVDPRFDFEDRNDFEIGGLESDSELAWDGCRADTPSTGVQIGASPLIVVDYQSKFFPVLFDWRLLDGEARRYVTGWLSPGDTMISDVTVGVEAKKFNTDAVGEHSLDFEITDVGSSSVLGNITVSTLAAAPGSPGSNTKLNTTTFANKTLEVKGDGTGDYFAIRMVSQKPVTQPFFQPHSGIFDDRVSMEFGHAGNGIFIDDFPVFPTVSDLRSQLDFD